MTEQILKAATPRPWHVYDRGIGYEVAVVRNGDEPAVNEYGAKGCFEKADAELIVLAVNAYEADHVLIRDLVTALENIAECIFLRDARRVAEDALSAAKAVPR